MKIDQETLAVMSTAFEYPAANELRITAQLDRAVYTRVNKVLEAIGGKWSRKRKTHVFDGDAEALVDGVIDAGEIATAQDMGHFPTPADLAEKLVDWAALEPGMSVLEPSAGDGDIVIAVAGIPNVEITAVERDLTRRKALVKLVKPLLVTQGVKLNVLDLDDCMLQKPEHAGRFDRVVMNPPFLKCGAGDQLDHVRHAFDLLKPCGRLVSVLPSSVTFRRDRRHTEFRSWYEEHGECDKLPEGSFKTSGTGVNTVVIYLDKR